MLSIMGTSPDTGGQLLTDLDLAGAAFAGLTAGIRPGQMTDPTPCPDVDVQGLVDHLIEGSYYFAGLLTGGHAGVAAGQAEGPGAAFREAAAQMRDAFSGPGVLDKTFDSPIGAASGAFFARVRIIELVGHGWDLARATGQSMELFPDDLCERTLAMSREVYADRTRARLADRQPVPDDAPAADKLAAFLGRAP